MAVLQRIREFFVSPEAAPEIVVAAPPTAYEVRPLTINFLDEVLALNQRCFKKGEHYTRHTVEYILSEPNALSYRVVTTDGEMVAFVFITMNDDGTGHITTIGVAPEHRRRKLAEMLMIHAEDALRKRRISTVKLEVRVSNIAAQNLYLRFNYSIVQRLHGYYNNGEDGFLMIKSLL